MKNIIISGFYLDFLKKSVYELENDNVINICKWIIGGAGFDVEHSNKIWWWDIVFDVKYPEQTRILSDEEINYLLPKFEIFQQHIVR